MSRIDLALIRRVADEIRPYCDGDDVAFLDTLDGETDAGDILDGLIASMLDDEAMVDAIKTQQSNLADRSRRIADRATAKRRTLGLVLDAAGLKKAERPRATVSRLAGRTAVVVTDPDQVPSQLCKVVTSPDKAAIKKQLEAGEIVPGCKLVVGDDTVSVRTK